MDRLYERGMLFDFYGELLTEHQQKIYSEAVFNDMSLSELSEDTGISRQGVHDLIKRCDKQLLLYEEKLHLVEKFLRIRKETENISAIIDKENIDPEIRKTLSELLNRIIEEV